MPTNQIDELRQAPPSALPTTPPPTAHTPEEEEYLKYLRDAMVFETVEPAPEGWKIYTTPKFLGRAALVAYAFTASSSWFATYISRADWMPVVCTPEMAIFGLPIAVAGGYIAWTAPGEPAVEIKRTWKGRLTTVFLVYLLLQTVAFLFNFIWINIFTLSKN